MKKTSPATATTDHDPAPRPAVWRALLVPTLGLAAFVAVGRWAGAYWPALEVHLGALGVAGYLVFFAAWVLLACACFPVSVLGFSAGVVFGFPVGVALVFVSANAAATLIFGLSRGLLRGRIRSLIASRPKLVAVDRLAGERALKLNALTRLSPLNYGLACYTLAAGRSSLSTYLLGNLATVPSMALQVWLGTMAVRSGQSAAADGLPQRWLIVVGAAAIFLGVLGWQVARLVREALLESEREMMDHETGAP